MKLNLNGRKTDTRARTAGELLGNFPSGTVLTRDGLALSPEDQLNDGDRLLTVSEAAFPGPAEWAALMEARYGPENQARLAAARVAVAGLGGLGSHAAASLARAGVGTLCLIDFDRVEPINLGRQHYFMGQLGRPKAEALAETIRSINPYLTVEALTERLTPTNTTKLLSGCQIIIEALDRPENKAELISTVLEHLPRAVIICASGLAGFDSANTIATRRLGPRLYLCGDGQSEVKPGQGLTAARVSVCAGHQANMALRLILNQPDP